MTRSKYQVIADDIRDKIISDKYQIDTAIPPELQLQKDYNVSRHTVRQAIAQLVNEGYLRKEKGSGTYVDSKYKNGNNSSQQMKTIGVVTTYLSDYIFPSIIRGIENTLREQGYSLLLASTNNDYELERYCLEKMVDYHVDGLIIEPTKSNQYNPNLGLYVNLREKGIPMVMIDAVYEELNASYICVDDVKSGFLATEYLIKNNHKNLLFITKIDDLQGKYRMKGFIKACEEHDVTFSSDTIITYTTETRKEVVGQAIDCIEKNNSVTGIVCYNDQIANSLALSLTELGYSIPDDYSIVGNDDSSLSRFGNIKLTTLNHPKEVMGKDAANWIIQTIEQGKPSENILYDPELIIRESVKEI